MSADYTATRLELQRIATHILARARFISDGRFGLRVTSTGIATPAFGEGGEVLRVAGATLIREHRVGDKAVSEAISLLTSSLQDLAHFAGLDLSQAFAAGDDSPPVGEIHQPIDIDPGHLLEILSWYRIGAEALDRVLVRSVGPSIVQLWPEHFDVGFDASSGSGRVNFGVSPGDGGQLQPYFYVGPWGSDRPGDPTFWNASFGAVATRTDLGDDPVIAGAAFFEKGLELLG